MTSYNATIELAGRTSAEQAVHVVDALADYHPAVGRSLTGHLDVVLTVQADTLRQAVSTALAVVQAADLEALAVEVLPTDEFDRRLNLTPIPELVSVTEAAQQLGVSRQAVQQRIDAGTLPAQRVGKSYVLVRSSLGSRVDVNLVGDDAVETPIAGDSAHDQATDPGGHEAAAAATPASSKRQ